MSLDIIQNQPILDNCGAKWNGKMAADVADDDLHALDVGREQADLRVHLYVDGDHFGLMREFKDLVDKMPMFDPLKR